VRRRASAFPGIELNLFAELIPDFQRLARPSVRAGRLFSLAGSAPRPGHPALESAAVNSLRRSTARFAAAGFAFVLCAEIAAADDARFLAPADGDLLASDVVHEARWSAPCDMPGDADEMELLLSLDGGKTFPIRLTAELPVCASTFRWRVPAVSSGMARLAVRIGEEGRAETERIAFVSGEFQIASSRSSPTAGLVQGPSEWWTEQALLEIGAESLLGGALRQEPERLHAPVTESDLEAPQSGLPEVSTEAVGYATPSPRDMTCGVSETLSLRRAAPLPLRE
jgi:hypothetical protein